MQKGQVPSQEMHFAREQEVPYVSLFPFFETLFKNLLLILHALVARVWPKLTDCMQELVNDSGDSIVE